MADPGAISAVIAQLTITSGLGPYTLGMPIRDKLPISVGYADGEILKYQVTDTSGTQEVSEGVFDLTANTLTRVTLIESSTGSFISWPDTGQRVITPLSSNTLFIISFSVGGQFGDMTPDEWDGNYEIFDVQVPMKVTFSADFLSSPIPGCEIAPTVDVVLVFQSIHAGTPSSVGTLTILAGQTVGTFSTSGQPIILPLGDRLRLYAASSVDTNITGAFATMMGTR